MKLFLDDYRSPIDCLQYMHKRIGNLNPIYNQPDWKIVRNYPEFVDAIIKHHNDITHISFDHDLADIHYHQHNQQNPINYDLNSDDINKTGYDAAKFLKEFYHKNNLKLPVMFVHSMNPVGTQNIINVFNTPN